MRALVLAAVCAYLLAASDVLALTNEPYGDDPQPVLDTLQATISATSHDSYEGGEVNFTVSLTDTGPMDAPGVFLYLKLSPGLRLVGRPARTLGSGCSGSSTLVCNIGSLFAHSAQTATVYLGVQITQLANQTLTAYGSAQGEPRSKVASFALTVGR